MSPSAAATVILALAGLASPARAADTVTLEALVRLARDSPRVAAARASVDVARARADEIDRAWIPTLELTAVAGPSPEVRCLPSPSSCVTTEPSELGLSLDGVFGRVEARAFAPLYTFGKLSAGGRAADAGVDAAGALAEAAAADATLDAARAYYAVKLGRELILMLEEGRERVDGELARVEGELADGSGEATSSDVHRLRAFRAEIDARLAEARRVEATGLAGVRLFAGEGADVDPAPLAEVEAELGALPAARTAARDARPERRAADAGVKAAEALADVEVRRWLPDLVVVGQAVLARATAADDPTNAFYDDPLNTSSISAGVALRWTFDPGVRGAKVRGARAELARARATATYAARGVAAEAERAWGEAADARDRLVASRAGEKEARAWLVATLQAASAGLAEPGELGDALLAYFTLRGRALQATFDWNVAVFALRRATGALGPTKEM